MIHLLIVLVVLGLIFWLLSTLPIPEPFKTAIYVVGVIILILLLLGFAGVGGVPSLTL